jgi:hypothetical protein
MYIVETDYHTLRSTVESWKSLPVDSRMPLVNLLARHLMSIKRIGVNNPEDLIIPYRYDRGDLKNLGHGYCVKQDLFIVGGKAAWAIEELMGIPMSLPEINEGLAKQERAKRAEEIKGYIKDYRMVPPYLAEANYPALVKTIRNWQALPATDRLRLVELLAAHLANGTKIGLKNNQELMIPYRLETGDMKRFDFKKFTKQDVYIVGGKAAWAIEELISMSLPEITEGQTERERDEQSGLISESYIRAYKQGVKHGLARGAMPLAK